MNVTFVVASNDDAILTANILSSPIFKDKHNHQILIQRGFMRASHAFNDAIKKSINDIIVFIHQDIFLPEKWDEALQSNIAEIECHDKQWGVLGCMGVTADGVTKGNVWCNANHQNLGGSSKPEVVRVLDEIVLVLHKKHKLLFSEDMQGFHLYGTDICLTAEKKGFRNYAICAWAFHNAKGVPWLPDGYLECVRYIRSKWNDLLPIYTPCWHIKKLSLANTLLESLKESCKRYRRMMFRQDRLIAHAQNPELAASVAMDTMRLHKKCTNVSATKSKYL